MSTTITLVCDQLHERNRTGAPLPGGRRFIELFPSYIGKTIVYTLNGAGIELAPRAAEWLLHNGYLTAKRRGYWGCVGGDAKRLERLCPAPGRNR